MKSPSLLISVMEKNDIDKIEIIVWDWRQRHKSSSPTIQSIRDCQSLVDLSQNQSAVETVNNLNLDTFFPFQAQAFALVGLMAEVDENDSTIKFICALKGLSSNASKPAFSEVHLEELCSSNTLEVFFSRLKSAIIALERCVHVGSLVECISEWQHQEESSDLIGMLRREYGNSLREEFAR